MSADIQGQYIVEFRVKDYRRIELVELQFEPKGQLIEITGRNGHGKSTLLEAFARLIRGAKLADKDPVRTGADKATLDAVLDDGTKISLSMTGADAKEALLRVRDQGGMIIAKPQEALDKIYDNLTLDPERFDRLGATKPGQREQMDELLESAGLIEKLKDIDRLVASLEVERRDANAEVKRISGIPLPTVPEGTPDAEISAEELKANLNAAMEHDRTIKEEDDNLKSYQSAIENEQFKATNIRAEIERLQADLKEIESVKIPKYESHVAEIERNIATRKPSFLQSAQDAFTKAESINAAVRNKIKRTQLQSELEQATKVASEFDDKLKAARSLKSELVRTAEFPVPGIGVDLENGYVTLHGKPLDQAAESERAVLCVKMAMAKKPQLKLCLLKGGTGIGKTLRDEIAKAAVENGCMVLVERFMEQPTEGIVIEDGRVFADHRNETANAGALTLEFADGEG